VDHAARAGELDPFAVFYIMERCGLSEREVREALTKRSGLLGISGVSSDLREIEAAAAKGHARAALTIEVLAYEVKKYIGAYAAAMGGLDAVAFAGGIGENSSRVREAACEGLGVLGLDHDRAANAAPGTADRVISTPASRVSVAVIYTNEELVVARETRRVLEA
jgi:acetate kinase